MRTKIICTIGPASESEDILRAMLREGMDVARLNMSHGTHEDHARRLALVRRIAAEEKLMLAVMADLQGPKFRIGDIPKEGVALAKGAPITLVDAREADFSAGRIPLPHGELIAAMKPGNRVLIDDGVLELRVESTGQDGARCTVVAGGQLLPRKGVSVPGAVVEVSSLTPKDRVDLQWAVSNGVDAIAQSFVRSADDVRELRALVKVLHNGDAPPHIVAKIEKPEAVADLANIIRVADVVMVARGDLGVETSAQEVPFYQKQIIRECVRAGVPVITATQMLQSMTKAPSPTRAEANDIANAVLDGTDAIMLSAESASGDYPVDSVRVMESIASRAEQEARSGAAGQINWFELCKTGGGDDLANAITLSAVQVAETIGAKAIVCLTRSGYTARMVNRVRPNMPVMLVSPRESVCRLASFMRNVQAINMDTTTNIDHVFDEAARMMRERGHVKQGERIVIVAGVPLGRGSGTTNLLKVHVA